MIMKQKERRKGTVILLYLLSNEILMLLIVIHNAHIIHQYNPLNDRNFPTLF